MNDSCGHRQLPGRPRPTADSCHHAHCQANRDPLRNAEFPVYGYNLQVFREDRTVLRSRRKGHRWYRSTAAAHGCLSTVWGDDDRFVSTYFSLFRDPQVYSSFDWGIKDKDGYHYILGRTDDVINVAGHRLGTREIEEAIQGHPAIAEVAVVGVADPLKGPMALCGCQGCSLDCHPRKRADLEEEAVFKQVDESLGAIARPSRVHFLTVLPKTRSGKLLRRSIQALAEGRDPGDLTTIEDPAALEQLQKALVR